MCTHNSTSQRRNEHHTPPENAINTLNALVLLSALASAFRNLKNADHDSENKDLTRRAYGEGDIRDAITCQGFKTGMFIQAVFTSQLMTADEFKRGY